VENAEDEGEGKEEEQWLAVETTEVGGELLSTVYVQCEQWRMQKTKEKEKEKGKEKEKEKGKGKRKSSGWRWKRRRLVVS
jgi:hypothetical protein